MSDQQHERLSKLLESREKSESEVKIINQQIDEAVRNRDRGLRVEHAVTSFEDAITKTIKRHNHFLELTPKLMIPLPCWRTKKLV